MVSTLPPLTETMSANFSEPSLDSSSTYGSNSCWAAALLKLKESKPKDLVGLDALAVLCSRAASIEECPTSGTSDVQDDAPRRRLRSVSNPEGMEKWDALSRSTQRKSYVPPSAIIEEEPSSLVSSALEDVVMADVPYSANHAMADGHYSNQKSSEYPSERDNSKSVVTPEENIDDPTELLRRARMKLLEDLHESGNEKGVLALPHSLSKYREVYNKNGRIGIYTPAERAAIISKFNSKRTRRVWNKKIRYNCRKNLADRRLRVKGRFVKRSSEEAAAALAEVAFSAVKVDDNEGKNTFSPPDSKSTSTSVSPSPSPPPSIPTIHEMEVLEAQVDEPLDTNDIEAGFEPTDDQPFRRTRRHTIT